MNIKNKNIIPFSAEFNRTLQNVQSILQKHWHVLHIQPELKKVFKESPTIAFRKRINIKQIFGGNAIQHNKS